MKKTIKFSGHHRLRGCSPVNQPLIYFLEALLNSIRFKLIWVGNRPKKEKKIIWSLAHSSLDTLDRVQRRHPKLTLSPIICFLCSQDSESSNLLFLHCWFAYKGAVLHPKYFQSGQATPKTQLMAFKSCFPADGLRRKPIFCGLMPEDLAFGLY